MANLPASAQILMWGSLKSRIRCHMQDPCQLEFYSKTCTVHLASEYTCGPCKITDASAATNLLRPLLLLTPRCLILSFFLVAAPSMTSSPSPSPVRGRLLHFPALPSANENMGYSITCLIFSPCCHSICLALKVICLEHHPSLLFVA